MKDAEPKRHRVFRDPAGTVHALAVAVPVARMESVLITMCSLRFPAQVAMPLDSALAEVTCAACMEKLAQGW